ncbi:Subunit of the glycosylphosphatidylinositol transamidase complex-like protein [Linderina macrospora]|uniref:Subunit of the glycosylphosphatidylinositol transamidase complex-like protein n=1 Tax=Linderina macrospora TaxID=4868 RepID=A0ACC1J900_9FUNG|nr:Subunit of the glycosylphosphatidylinositol transamidase complex-like protein [Linderina macrospora]
MHRPLSTSNATQHHYHKFPRQIGEIAHRYNVEELHLSFTQGSWRSEQWGPPTISGHGAGAEVRAKITEDADEDWRGLTNALSGVFCASLNFIDATNTNSPQLSFKGMRHGYLPKENVCTENLTPWVKQLPCQGMAGLGALLNPYRLYNMHFHSMSVDLAPIAVDGKEVLGYKQTLAVVVNPKTFGLEDEWTLAQLVDRDVKAACAAAERSTIRVLQGGGSDRVVLEPKPESEDVVDGYRFGVYDAKKQGGKLENIKFSVDTGAAARQRAAQPAIVAHRYVTGHGGSSGGVESTIVNNSDKVVHVSYMDTLPWYLRLYMHTLTVESESLVDGTASKLKPSSMHYKPAVDRGRPALLELEMDLPAQSRVTLRYGFDKGFLKYSEHPPDANRGFNIGPAIVSYTPIDTDLACAVGAMLEGTGARKCTARVYTELFLASLPTPDFSMPYNVITFTCTILALFFGRMFNLLTRDFVVLKETKDAGQSKKDE